MSAEIFRGRTLLQWAKLFVRAARAGGAAMDRFLRTNRGFTTTEKTKGDFVTELDLASSDGIQGVLESELGDDLPDVLDEEDPESHKLIESSELLVVIDPEDGTQTENASGGRSQNTGIGISLIYKGQVVVAVAMQPKVSGWNTVVATCGGGAYLLRRRFGFTQWKKVRIDDGRPVPSSLVLAIPLSHASPDSAYGEFINPLRKAKILGNSGGFFCAVGNLFGLIRGDMHAYANVTGGTVYDLGILDLIVREMGGIAETVKGEQIVWDRMVIPCLFARNREVADMILSTWVRGANA